MEKKNYRLEILYDNGVQETFETGLVSEEEINHVSNVFDQAFSEGLDAVVTVPSPIGVSYIKVSSVARVNIYE